MEPGSEEGPRPGGHVARIFLAFAFLHAFAFPLVLSAWRPERRDFGSYVNLTILILGTALVVSARRAFVRKTVAAALVFVAYCPFMAFALYLGGIQFPDRISEPSEGGIASLKAIVTAEEQYRAASGAYGTLASLSAGERFIDRVLGRGKKSGFSFVLTLGAPADSSYQVTATPLTWSRSGEDRVSVDRGGIRFYRTHTRGYFTDNSGVIRFRVGAAASSGDSPIE